MEILIVESGFDLATYQSSFDGYLCIQWLPEAVHDKQVPLSITM